MNRTDDQIRGWKEIAAHLQVSVRTARRWEVTRALPLRRVSGGSQDAVFARRSELYTWMTSHEATGAAEGGLGSSSDEGRTPVGPDHRSSAANAPGGLRPSETSGRRWLALTASVAVIGVLVIVAFVMVRSSQDRVPSAAARSQVPLTVPAVNLQAVEKPGEGELMFLKLSLPDGWTGRIRIPEGQAGQLGGGSGRPALLLRPSRVAAHLRLEIARADGRPVNNRPGTVGPFTIVLEPGVAVQVLDPFPFQVEWERPARSR